MRRIYVLCFIFCEDDSLFFLHVEKYFGPSPSWKVIDLDDLFERSRSKDDSLNDAILFLRGV